jgi:hypothetical protein
VRRFPQLILRPSKSENGTVIKGITNLEENAFHLLLEKFNNLYVETDMRAMYNPSRMTVIQNATKKLVEKINSCCPNCNIQVLELQTLKEA